MARDSHMRYLAKHVKNDLEKKRFDRVIREDIRDLTSLRNVALIQLLLTQLKSRVGTLVVVSNLARENSFIAQPGI